jgi:endonuclease/exonuclease/phosphatase family metal-dependent hydrolase
MHRVVIMTHNLWADSRWPEREPALRELLRVRPPDVLATQELRAFTRELVDEELIHHARVHDDERGWEVESNIWWDERIFELVTFGTEDIGLNDELSPREVERLGDDRRLFWVRLRHRSGQAPPLVVATAHYTFPGSELELTERVNPRIRQSELTIDVLERIAPDEPCVFMGDLNEAWHTMRILRAGGLMDSFGALRMVPPPTWPTVPTWQEASAPWVIDFQLHKGPIRPMATEVVEFFHGDLAPSDHKPVVTTYALDSQP